MEQLETQVAKIEIGNNKQANTYVFVMAESEPTTGAELFMIVELPLFNPAAAPDCARIAQVIAAALHRSYRKQINENTFENTLTQINEELANLAEVGKTHWVGKLNALVGVKTGDNLYVTSTGKITALLLREGALSTISDSPSIHHPLKTFENFAIGRLKLDDILILSTSQLFNYISIDRLKNLLLAASLPGAAQQVIDILQENAGPEIAFGTLITSEVEPGYMPETSKEVDLQEFVATSDSGAPLSKSVTRRLKQVWLAAASQFGQVGAIAVALVKNRKRVQVMQLIRKNRDTLAALGQNAKQNLSPKRFNQFSRSKKFFFISAVVLFIAIVSNILITAHYKKVKTEAEAFTQQVSQLQNSLNDANAAFLYRDETKAASLLGDMNQKIKDFKNLNQSQQQEVDGIKKQVGELQDKIEHKQSVKAESVATLSNADSLIKLTNYFATQTNGAIISYNRANGSIQDNTLKSSETIVRSASVKNGLAVIYNGTSLINWNTDTSSLGSPFIQNVPTQERAAGLAYYPVNKRVYIANENSGDIVSFAVGDKGMSKPVLSVAGADDARHTVDLTVDGAVYVLTNSGHIAKYLSGKPAEFNQPGLATPLSGDGRIYSQNDFKNLYILDKDNHRILILDKKGNVISQLTSDLFNDLKDFSIDEKTKTIFVLNGNSLLKVGF